MVFLFTRLAGESLPAISDLSILSMPQPFDDLPIVDGQAGRLSNDIVRSPAVSGRTRKGDRDELELISEEVSFPALFDTRPDADRDELELLSEEEEEALPG